MNKFFIDDIERYGTNIALVENDNEITYSELGERARKIADCVPERSLVFCICQNTMASIIGYVGFLKKRIVPIMLSSEIDKELLQNLLDVYEPQYIWCPNDFLDGDTVYSTYGYTLLKYSSNDIDIHPDLAVLLTTSGSTGSPKFVRQTYRNIQANTESIVEYLGIVSDDKPITTLPMNYTYGLSIIQSHLMAGASIYLSESSFFEQKFWKTFKEKEITTFGAVPYTYQILSKLRFLNMDLPNLKYITQAGGKLGEKLHYEFAAGLRKKGQALIVMYGATEATARMSYVPPEKSVEKAGSIGIPIPGGRFELIDIDGNVIVNSNEVGELVYYGDNVTLGYAMDKGDLIKDDENIGRLETGDMAKRDDDGYYFVVGRKKRFLKIYGNRVNLVEIETLLEREGYEVACVGEDDKLRIYTTSNDNKKIIHFISNKTGLNPSAFKVINICEIPHNESGKVLYSELK